LAAREEYKGVQRWHPAYRTLVALRGMEEAGQSNNRSGEKDK